jgi:CheY-like chemotaxis protein
MPPRSILLVDDHVDSARALAVLLRREGHAVTVAAGVAEALVAAAAMGPIDVLVSDLSLRDGDGCSLLRVLADRAAGAPRLAVALTGHSEPHWFEECRRAGYDRFLSKPVELQDLLAAVRESPPGLPMPGGVPAPAEASATPLNH